MFGKSDYLEGKVADDLFGLATFTKPASLYVALFLTHLTDAGSGTEMSGNTYARVEVTRDGIGWQRTTNEVSNAADIIFPQATADWGFVKSAALMDASTAGNVWYPLPLIDPRKHFVTEDVANIVYCAGHGLADDDQIIVFEEDASVLPSGMTNQAEYYVVSSTTNTFQIALTVGGAVVNIGNGAGYVAKTQYRQVVNGVKMTFEAGSLKLYF